jgi:hypothetical protein
VGRTQFDLETTPLKGQKLLMYGKSEMRELICWNSTTHDNILSSFLSFFFPSFLSKLAIALQVK